MPLIVVADAYETRLRAQSGALPPAVPAQAMRHYPVSRLVSNACNDVPACLDPIDLARSMVCQRVDTV